MSVRGTAVIVIPVLSINDTVIIVENVMTPDS